MRSTILWVMSWSSLGLPTAHLGLEAVPALPDHVAELRVQLHQQRLAARTGGGDQGATRSTEGVEHHLAAVGGVPDGPLDKREGLHRRVLLAALGAVHLPDRGLCPVRDRVVRGAGLPAV